MKIRVTMQINNQVCNKEILEYIANAIAENTQEYWDLDWIKCETDDNEVLAVTQTYKEQIRCDLLSSK